MNQITAERRRKDGLLVFHNERVEWVSLVLVGGRVISARQITFQRVNIKSDNLA